MTPRMPWSTPADRIYTAPVLQAKLPYQPFHTGLYRPAELFEGFDPERPASYGETMDFRTYRHFVRTGRGTDAPFFEGMMQSLHDNSVAKALHAFLRRRRF